MTKTILWENKVYPVREVDLGTRCFMLATESLEKRLLDEDGVPISAEAERIDNSIYFYVEDDAIELPDQDLVDIAELKSAV